MPSASVNMEKILCWGALVAFIIILVLAHTGKCSPVGVLRENHGGGGGGGHGGGGGGGHGGGWGGGGHGGWGGGRGGRGGWGRGRGGWRGGSWYGGDAYWPWWWTWWNDPIYYYPLDTQYQDIESDPCDCFGKYKTLIDAGVKKEVAEKSHLQCLEKTVRGDAC